MQKTSCAESSSCLEATPSISQDEYAAYADILSQAITGELVGMENFAALALITDDLDEKLAAFEHANSERGHALTFLKAAQKLQIPVKIDLDARYWGRLRRSFRNFVDQRDSVACYLAQEVMLESLAVSMYRNVGKALDGHLGEVFTKIADDEERHLSHYLVELRHAWKRDPQGFEDKVHSVHKDFMSIIAEMTASDDPSGHCGLCHDACIKTKLGAVNLDMARLRGGAMQVYLTMLDEIGLPGEKTLQWMCELPA
jgi:rubrerythrin